MTNLFMVFDVESIGLHGEGFAVGWVVIDRAGNVVGQSRWACDPINASGGKSGRAWVAENVPPSIFPEVDDFGPDQVRAEFWAAWQHWKAKGALLAADCAWPVEARFLIHCVNADPDVREWEGPYPLVDVASVRLAAGLDPLATVERLPNELPIHDPLADARQSARLLIEAMDRIKAGKVPC